MSGLELSALHGRIAKSAPELHRVSALFCEGSQTLQSDECRWYHGTWQYLRALDLVSSPTWHDSFYSEALGRSIAEASHTLIAGTADFSMLAYVLDARLSAQSTSRVTVIDLCRTPLYACRWYVRRTGQTGVDVCQQDILTLSARGHQPFDLVTTDAFLTRFAAPRVIDVLSSIRAATALGGALITTVRLGTSSGHGDRSADIEQFAERAGSGAASIGLDAHRLRELARDYATRMKSHPIGNAAAIRGVFESSGWRVDHFEEADVKGELVPTKYARIVARREH